MTSELLDTDEAAKVMRLAAQTLGSIAISEKGHGIS